ncbi:MAG: RNA polymerase sigma factor [Saprospiraceae bacterium]|jgi:RNA polymerase sigma-70 factor (ECF subfamily)|nr:RNA polymerase sigma factor [Saprospiraceae bacterium]MBL0024592.1 RNA polymerase sigma factor [Saprospiraceae bacterium]
MSPLLVNGKTEKDLIKACLSGDRQAQRDVFYMYSGKMMAVCIRFSRHRQEAEDLLQDSFVKIFTHLKDFENKGSFEGWIRRIIVNTAIKNNLKKSVIAEEIDLDHIVEEMSVPEVFSVLSEEELIKLISGLPDGYRMVFNLFAIEGFTHKEISEILNIEESTSRSQLTKARKMLKEKVNDLYKVAV